MYICMCVQRGHAHGRARHPVRRDVARHRVHEREAILHLGLGQVPGPGTHVLLAARKGSADGDRHRPALEEGGLVAAIQARRQQRALHEEPESRLRLRRLLLFTFSF